jgi:hypothetical protein
MRSLLILLLLLAAPSAMCQEAGRASLYGITLGQPLEKRTCKIMELALEAAETSICTMQSKLVSGVMTHTTIVPGGSAATLAAQGFAIVVTLPGDTSPVEAVIIPTKGAETEQRALQELRAIFGEPSALTTERKGSLFKRLDTIEASWLLPSGDIVQLQSETAASGDVTLFSPAFAEISRKAR